GSASKTPTAFSEKPRSTTGSDCSRSRGPDDGDVGDDARCRRSLPAIDIPSSSGLCCCLPSNSPLEVPATMYRPFTEQNSFVSRTLLLLAAIVLLPALAVAATHPLFNLDSTTQSPTPSDRFTVLDRHQNTGLRVNLPFPNCATNPSDCLDITLLNQLDGFNLQPRISIPFDGAIDASTVNSHTVFLIQLPGGHALRRNFDDDDFDGDGDRDERHHHSGGANIIGINQVVWDPATLTLFVQSD